jgi:hypothetical protein
VAVGFGAGVTTQGTAAVAVGTAAGQTNQANNSIILNATGSALDQTTANTFTVAPVRNDVANTGQVMFYNTTSKEITYGNVINVAGNVSAGNLLAAGLSLSGNVVSALVSAANITTTANISGNFILGNGSLLTGIAASYGNANVVANVAALGSNPVSTTGNITGGNVLTGGILSATGNIFANNLGNISSINLNGNASAVLYGNGIFAAVAGGSSTVNTGYNVGAGVVVLAGAIKVRYNGMGDIELQATSGTIGAYWTGQYITASTSTVLESSRSLNTSVWWAIGANVGSTGDTIIITLMDTTNGKIYRVTTIITPTGNCGSVIVETLI